LYVSPQKRYSAIAPTVIPRNPAGAGAAFSAGYIYGCLCKWDPSECLRFAVRSGSIYCSREASLATFKLHTQRRIQNVSGDKTNRAAKVSPGKSESSIL